MSRRCETCGHLPDEGGRIPHFNGGIIDDREVLDGLGLTHWLIYWWEEDWRPRQMPGPAGGVLTVTERHGTKLMAAEYGVATLEITPAVRAAIEADIYRQKRHRDCLQSEKDSK